MGLENAVIAWLTVDLLADCRFWLRGKPAEEEWMAGKWACTYGKACNKKVAHRYL